MSGYAMSENVFKFAVMAIAAVFTLFFVVVVVPPLIDNPDILGAFAAGFVNPYASGYSADVISCWAILAVWVWFEAATRSVKHGWICLVIGIVPGVALGFALYLLLRHRQLTTFSELNS